MPIFSVEENGLDAAIEYLMGSDPFRRLASFGRWWLAVTITAKQPTDALITLYCCPTPTSVPWERYNEFCTRSDLPDVIRRIFTEACFKGFSPKFQGDPHP